MQNLCPLCLKNGVKKKIKLLQINFQEAVWVCEEEKCVWPFGYEDFILCPRVVGKIWSCYWNDQKSSLPRVKENLTALMQSPLCNTHVPSVTNALKEMTSNVGTPCSINIEGNCDSLNKRQTESELNKISTNPCIESTISHIDDKKQSIVDGFLLNKNNICGGNSINSDFSQSIGNNTNDLRLQDECKNLSIAYIKQNHAFIQDTKNISSVRGIPKIKSIEKTNIDISNVKIGNQISLYQHLNKNMICLNKATDVTETKLPSKPEKLSDFDTIENDKSVHKSNLRVTKVEIEGLPPITLSFKTPVYMTNPETVTSNIKLSENKPDTKPNGSGIKTTVIKRNVSSGKQYEKFSFSALKNKAGSSNSINTNNDNGFFSVETNQKMIVVEKDSKNKMKEKDCNKNINIQNTVNISNNSKQTIPDVCSTCTINEFDSCMTNLSGQEDVSPDTLVTNISMSLDTVLEDLLTNDYSVSEDINDEWLNSLLS